MKTYTDLDSNMIGYLRCPKCGGELQYVEEVSGAFFYRINEDGSINFNNKEFSGDSWISVECRDCNARFNWDWDNNCIKIILKEEFM